MFPTLPHPVTATSTSRKMNLLALVQVEETVDGENVLNTYMYVRASAAFDGSSTPIGVFMNGDHVGSVESTALTSNISMSFAGIARANFANDDYGFILFCGCVSAGLTGTAAEKNLSVNGSGLLAADTLGASAAGDIGYVGALGTAYIRTFGVGVA